MGANCKSVERWRTGYSHLLPGSNSNLDLAQIFIFYKPSKYLLPVAATARPSPGPRGETGLGGVAELEVKVGVIC